MVQKALLAQSHEDVISVFLNAFSRTSFSKLYIKIVYQFIIIQNNLTIKNQYLYYRQCVQKRAPKGTPLIINKFQYQVKIPLKKIMFEMSLSPDQFINNIHNQVLEKMSTVHFFGSWGHAKFFSSSLLVSFCYVLRPFFSMIIHLLR